MLAVLASPAAAGEYLVRELTIPGASSVVARAIDNDGRILGSMSGVPSGNLFLTDGEDFQAFSLPEPLPTPGGEVSVGTVNPFDMTSTGMIVGEVFEDDGTFEPPGRGFRTNIFDASQTDVLELGVTTTPPDTAITGISSAGNIVAGWMRGDVDENLRREAVGFIYDFDTETLTPIRAFGDSGTFVWGMNSSGALVGNGSQGAFLWESGVTTLLTGPAGEELTADGISDSGIIAGRVSDSGSVYVLDQGNFTTFEVPGSLVTLVEDVNDQGEVVGFYFDANFDFRSFHAVPVPEPSSAAIVSVLASVLLIRPLLSKNGRPRFAAPWKW